jgi:chromosome segregation protein
MQLKRLEVAGFKSFANRTSFDFEPGIAVLVGPNGSGKSNVADAVRWVLGEQSARVLRGKRAEEVIFAGSRGRPQLGLAEVSLLLDNCARPPAVEYDELRISRRLYRSGESEYLLNGARVRRRDLIDLLLQFGLDSEGYAIVGQGAVEQLVMQRPEERRAVLEHAADISRHQSRLAEARSRLAGTEQNLLRCDDLLAELEPHGRRLRSQAEKAARYAQRRSELGALARAYYRHSLRECELAVQQAEAALSSVAAECEALSAALTSLDLQRTDARQALAALERTIAECRQTLEGRRREREATLSELLENGRQTAFLEARVEALQRESERALHHLDELSAEAANSETKLVEHDDLADQLTCAEQATAQLANELLVARRNLDAARAHEARLLDQQQRLDRRTEQVRASEEQARRQEAERASRRAELVARRDEAGARQQRLQTELDTAKANLTAAGKALADAQHDRQVARLGLDAPRQQERSLRADAEVVRASLKALSDDGAALATGVSGLANRPILASSLLVPPRYEFALAAALGEWATARMVEDGAEALLGLESDSSGRLLLVRPDQTDTGGRRFAERIRPLLAGLAAEPLPDLVKGTTVALAPLALAIVAADLRTAHEVVGRLVQAGECGWQVVTENGWVLGDGGAFARGAESRAARMVGLRRRQDELSRSLRDLDRQVAAAAEMVAASERALADAEAEERSAQAAEASARADERGLRRRLEEVVMELRRLDESLARTPPILVQVPVGGSADLPARREELRRAQQSAADDLRARAGGLGQLQTQWERAWSEQEDLRRRADRIAAERRAREELGQARARELLRAEKEQARLSVELTAAFKQLEERRLFLAAAEARAAALVKAEAAVAGEIDDLVRRRDREAQRVEQHEQQIQQLRAQLDAVQPARESASLVRQRAVEDLARHRQEAEQVAEEWALGGSSVVQLRLLGGIQPADESTPEAELEPDIDLPSVRRRLTALQRELRAFGAVSESVLDEYQEVKRRIRFLGDQASDLRAGLAECRAVIDELEELMRQGFNGAFERVNQAFAQTFSTLFGGGLARLILTEPDDPLRTGVDIVAQPPGKRLQSLMSLSGGERALTSTALVFALLAINPLPFCVLDEVDAALDEPNARRFAALLGEYSEHTQFVIITHNRATMEIAQTLHGISMGSDGVTTVLSLRPVEALAQALNGQAQDGSQSLLQV